MRRAHRPPRPHPHIHHELLLVRRRPVGRVRGWRRGEGCVDVVRYDDVGPERGELGEEVVLREVLLWLFLSVSVSFWSIGGDWKRRGSRGSRPRARCAASSRRSGSPRRSRAGRRAPVRRRPLSDMLLTPIFGVVVVCRLRTHSHSRIRILRGRASRMRRHGG